MDQTASYCKSEHKEILCRRLETVKLNLSRDAGADETRELRVGVLRGLEASVSSSD